MSNTLTGQINNIYEALDVVSRELTGMIPAVAKNVSAESAAIDQTVRIPVAPAASLVEIAPANVSPDSGGQVIGYKDMTISKSYAVPVAWTGEEQKSLEGRANNIMKDQFSQAFRAITNQVEADLCSLYIHGSRAYGTAGATPFSSSLEDAARMKKILDDNGAPDDGMRSIVANTSAGVNLRSLAHLTANYSAGTTDTLRQGVLLPLFGMDVRESAGIKSHTKGAGTGYVVVAAGAAADQTTVSMDGGDSGTIKAGDIVTFGTGGGSGTGTDYDTKYVVASDGAAAAAKIITLGAPGLLVARVNDDACTVGSSYVANMAFHKNAIQLITRAPEMPQGGDSAEDVMLVTDPISGLTFQIVMYKQYRQVHFEVGLAWGYAAIKPEHISVLIG